MLCLLEVKVVPLCTLNTCKGVVLCCNVKDKSEEGINVEPAAQMVVATQCAFFKNNIMSEPSNHFVLTFNQPEGAKVRYGMVPRSAGMTVCAMPPLVIPVPVFWPWT